jgi:hypothetical protein
MALSRPTHQRVTPAVRRQKIKDYQGRYIMQMSNPVQLTFFQSMEPYFAASIENGLKILLEVKHLYQKVKIELPDKEIARQKINELISGATRFREEEDPLGFFDVSPSNIEWRLVNPHEHKYAVVGSQSEALNVSIHFNPPTIKLFCRTCKRVEAYNFLYGSDILSEFTKVREDAEFENKQVFSVTYQCQSCKGIPEVFMVRRDGLNLVQSGRTPIEEIEVPAFLPKEQKKYFSDAIVAFNSGQTLAGNFLLRTFIEQYVRSQSSIPNSQSADFLFSEYNEKMPQDFKMRFPSLQAIYDKLSNDLHLATASEDTFTQSRSDIVKHFRAREVYEL